MKKILAMLVTVLVTATTLTAVGVLLPRDDAAALSGADFDPGYIISDEAFFDGGRMSEAQIQGFLDARVGGCLNSACLDVLRTDTTSRAADAMCAPYAGARGESVARIISKVARVCGITPQVLLVTLQKEQSLVSGATARQPSAARLERAMGYACPDNVGGACDPTYAGVYNQIYRAAWQFKRYANPPGTSQFFTQYRPGATHSILYNPNPACGTRSVTVRNQATANLYYYTPYTPNQAALSSLRGTGDGCSAYGNRNFWVYFTDWFGSPTSATAPVGHVDALAARPGGVSVRGWALDPTSSRSIQVHVYVDGVGTPLLADRARPDVAAAYPGVGAAHGFDAVVDAAAGDRRVCVYAIGQGTNAELACRTLRIPSVSPVGSVDQLRAEPGGGVTVRGWALDAESAASLDVRISVDGAVTTVRAAGARPDVAAAYPGSGAAHGFSTVLTPSRGTREICVTAVNVGRGSDSVLECRSVRVPGPTPSGRLDTAKGVQGGVKVSGWAIDGSTRDPIDVHVYVGNKGTSLPADVARKDIGRLYPAFGSGHGFSSVVTAPPGRHQVCAYAIRAGTQGDGTLLACRTVTVPNAVPLGSVDEISATSSGVRVRGWAWDPDTAAPTTVHVYLGDARTVVSANLERADVARVHPAAGGRRGFDVVVPARPGRVDVCAFALDSSGGENPRLRCSPVTVP